MRTMSRNLEEGEKALPSQKPPRRQVRQERPVFSLRGSFVFVCFAVLSSLTVAAAPCSPALAREAEVELDEGGAASAELELEPIVVIGSPALSEREEENPTKFMTVVPVRESEGRVESASSALNRSVGVKVNEWGGLGGFATVSIRGSSPSQVQVYVDGVPMNRAATGVANLEDLPLDSIEYIEVYRGFTPADFGAAGIGGAVNLVTRKGLDRRGSLAVSYGSYETYKVTATAAGPAGPAELIVIGSYGRSRGDFEYENDNGTPLNRADDFTETRINNDFESYDLLLRAQGDRGRWEWAAVSTVHDKDQGLPGLSSSQAERTRLETTRGTMNLSLRNRGLLAGGLDLTLGADGLYESQLYDDPRGELGTFGPTRTENLMSNAGARVKAIWSNPDRSLLFTTYGEYREERFQPVEHLPDREEGVEQRRVALTGVLQVELTDPSGTFTVQAALRHERYESFFEGDPYFDWSGVAGETRDIRNLTSPSVGALLRVGDHLVFKGNAGRFYRAPTFYELFGMRGVIVGNPSLKPEVGINFDLGFVYHRRRLGPLEDFYLEYAFFQSRTKDLIVFFQNSQRTLKAVNVGAAVIAGHELSFAFGVEDALRFSGNYTFQSAVDRGEVPYWRGNALPMRPMHQFFGRVDYQVLEELLLFGEGTYVSGNYWDRANLYEVPDRRIYNLGFSWDFYQRKSSAWSLSGELKNFTDERVADVAGYPLPGRLAYVTVQARW